MDLSVSFHILDYSVSLASLSFPSTVMSLFPVLSHNSRAFLVFCLFNVRVPQFYFMDHFHFHPSLFLVCAMNSMALFAPYILKTSKSIYLGQIFFFNPIFLTTYCIPLFRSSSRSYPIYLKLVSMNFFKPNPFHTFFYLENDTDNHLVAQVRIMVLPESFFFSFNISNILLEYTNAMTPTLLYFR